MQDEVSYLSILLIYVHDEEPSKTYITQEHQAFAHFVFAIICRNSSTTQLEDPNISMIFLTWLFPLHRD